jgi:uncharacterized protein YijF (DUF1287 family)
MKKTLLCFWIVFVVSILQNPIAISSESCRFLSADFPKIAEESRKGEMWAYEDLIHFLSDQAQSHARLLISNKRQECATFQNLPAAKTLQMILEKVALQGFVQQVDWQDFLGSFERLTCEEIHKNGQPFLCSNDRLVKFIEGARRAALSAAIYDPSYARIDTVNGDIPSDRGVCSDVLVRGLRAAGIDLQELVYKDMQKRFQKYQYLQKDKSAPDRNIDHRRVTNLMVYFKGDVDLFVTLEPPDTNWMPGDIIAWNLMDGKGFVPHIGVVSDRKGSSGEYMVIHHLPLQGREDDMLHGWTVIGHFRPLLGD